LGNKRLRKSEVEKIKKQAHGSRRTAQGARRKVKTVEGGKVEKEEARKA